VLNKRSAILLNAAIGMALELAVHAMSGRREAWDILSFPFVAAAFVGTRFRSPLQRPR
jgi:hypothetical protein